MIRVALLAVLMVPAFVYAEGGRIRSTPVPATPVPTVDPKFKSDVDAAGAADDAEAATITAALQKLEARKPLVEKAIKETNDAWAEAEAAAVLPAGALTGVEKRIEELQARAEKLRQKTGIYGFRSEPTKEAIAEANEITNSLIPALRKQIAAADQKKKDAEIKAVEARKKVTESTDALAAIEKEMETTRTSRKQKEDDAKKSRDNVRDQIALLAAQVRGAQLGTKLESIKGLADRAELRMAVIENELNQSLIADFMKKKMEALLGDTSFCEVANKCAANPGANSGKKDKVDLKHLFDTTERDRANGAKSETHR